MIIEKVENITLKYWGKFLKNPGKALKIRLIFILN